MENFNLDMNIKEFLSLAHKTCQITLNGEESTFMYKQLEAIHNTLPLLNKFNDKIREKNIQPFSKFWQKTKLRPDIVESADLQALFQNSKKMSHGYFEINGSLYGEN